MSFLLHYFVPDDDDVMTWRVEAAGCCECKGVLLVPELQFDDWKFCPYCGVQYDEPPVEVTDPVEVEHALGMIREPDDGH